MFILFMKQNSPPTTPNHVAIKLLFTNCIISVVFLCGLSL